MNATISGASILAVAFPAATCTAQAWTQLAPATSPSARLGHAMAYDSHRAKTVLFGGLASLGMPGGTWEWDGTVWTQVNTNGPSGRRSGAMAYDSQRGRTVLFGGQDILSQLLNDTWEWNGTSWLQMAPPVSPPVRNGHAMTCYAGRVVLFGGSQGSGYFGDTWEWNGTNWVQRTPAAGPSARTGHAMAYDAARQRVVLFGGLNTTGNLGDTWEWDGINWLARFSLIYPSPRAGHAMAYDEARQRVVLFGGSYLGDTWAWNGTTWTQLTPSTSPSARAGHAMAYEEARQRAVLFGGSQGSGYLGDTWAWSSASATAYGAGCGAPALGFVPDTNGRPLLGQTGSASIVNAPTPVAAVAMGWSKQFYGPFALPVTLAGIGMPGCDLQQSADILGLDALPLTPSTLSFALAIPSAPSLIGLHVYMQAYAFAPGVNPLQIIISNGIDWVLGND